MKMHSFRNGLSVLMAVSIGLCCLIVASSAVAQSTKRVAPLHLKSNQLYLIVDPRLQGEQRGVTLTLHPFKRYEANPVLFPEHPWEGKSEDCQGLVETGGNVLYDADEKVYRMWYDAFTKAAARGFVCYATSKDGIHWEKPKLGIHEYEGSKENNIVTFGNTAGVTHVYRNPDTSDPAKRWAMWGKQHRPSDDGVPANYAVYRHYSPDGIHWTREQKEPNLPYHHPAIVLGGLMGDAGSTFWLPQLGKHVAIHQTVRHPNPRPAPSDPQRDGQRIFVRWDSPDGHTWSEPAVAFDSDEEDLKADPYHQFYNATITPFGDVFIGLLAEYHPEPGTMDLGFAISTDTVTWVRPFHGNPVLPQGSEGAWDSQMVSFCTQLLEKDGEWWLYYSGESFHHHETDYSKWYAAIGLATLPIGRMVSADVGPKGGVVETPPINVPDGILYVNCDATGGELRVEVLDTEGKVLPLHAVSDCLPVTGDQTAASISWNAGPIASTFSAGTTVRLRFHLTNAKLYGFAFR